MTDTLKTMAALVAVLLMMLACSDRDDTFVEEANPDAQELSGIMPVMTRAEGAVSVAELKDYVGKKEFANKDRAVFVSIKRTARPIPQFTYSDIEFVSAVSKVDDVTSIGWSRDKNTGTTEGSTETTKLDRIYWTDATNEHTFIGYCAPQQSEGNPAFDWKKEGSAYYGSLSNPLLTGEGNDTIDFRSTFDVAGNETKSGNVELCKNDILLTYSTEIKANDAIAKLYFYHGLAQVRVIVNISDFAAASDKDDTKSVVSDMKLKNMLTMYKWQLNGVATEALSDADQAALNAIYGTPAPSFGQRKDVNLWIPQPKGVGEKSSRTFTFYGLAVPTTITESQPLSFSFNVTYPDPMKPTVNKTHTYTASIKDIKFDAGKCTTINISLNHKNEKMTVGAQYDDWDFENTPDQGELKKNLTFLRSTTREIKDSSTGYYNVTILGDPNANADDATWLYVDTNDGKIKDIYGNDGSSDFPFQISTADQLLSFAYEVKGTNRGSVTYKDLSGASRTLSANFDFTGYHIALDADITLQESEKKSKLEMDLKKADKSSDEYIKAPALPGVSWIGVGDKGKPFNGTFLGGYRHINRLYGRSFFNTIGESGIVDHLFISNALQISGRGSIAEINYGVICGAYIEGNIVTTKDGARAAETTIDCCGSIVGENHSMLISCAHIGDIKGTGYSTVGALLGYNDGIVAICYNCGNVEGNGEHQYAGIGEYTYRSIAYSSYFNRDLYKAHDYENLNEHIGHVAFPLSMAMMQSNSFVNKTANMYGDLRPEDEIYVDGIDGKTDPFFFHLSLNYGIRRAVAMLRVALSGAGEGEDITIHRASGGDSDPNRFEDLTLKKSLVKWLVEHYSTEQTPGGELDYTHQFKFIPGTYPKLQ